MKVVAFNGSPRAKSNTYHCLGVVCRELGKAGIETEIVQVGGQLLHGCIDCGYCARVRDATCAIKDDMMNELIAKAKDADGLLIGSPVYFGNVTPEIKALIDRLGRISRRSGNFLARKVGAPVVVQRRAGSNFVYAAINYLFGITEMIVPASSYWNVVVALKSGEWEADTEGVQTLEKLGENMAWLMKKVAAD